jgi:hypothetical protein
MSESEKTPPPPAPPVVLDDDMAEMARVAADAGKGGNIYAIEVSRRLREGRRGRIRVDLPALDTREGIEKAQVALIHAVAAGGADLRDAADLSGMLDNLRRSLAAADLEQRLRTLEQANADRAAKAERR